MRLIVTDVVYIGFEIIGARYFIIYFKSVSCRLKFGKCVKTLTNYYHKGVWSSKGRLGFVT